MSSEDPPPFENSVNIFQLVSATHSKIVNVNLYSGHAEITRMLQFEATIGENQVVLTGLPTLLDKDSVRVEGRGAATIHEVTLSSMSAQVAEEPTDNTRKLKELIEEQGRLQSAKRRSRNASKALAKYLDSFSVQQLESDRLAQSLKRYKEAEQLEDEEQFALQSKLDEIRISIDDVNLAIAKERQEKSRLQKEAKISLFVKSPGTIKIYFIYSVNNASWNVSYDLRVDMNTKEKPISLVYKAAIMQNTGEEWRNTTITLETANQEVGANIPELQVLKIRHEMPPSLVFSGARRRSRSRTSPVIIHTLSERSRSYSRGRRRSRSRSFSPEGAPVPRMIIPEITPAVVPVSSKGDVSATYEVAGRVNIPSDAQQHNVTVAELELDATMEWVAVPKVDGNVHLKAKIKNESEYTLLGGPAKVYVDGSYISTSTLPLVSPQEAFDCSLGLDPSIRITTTPLSKSISKSGVLNKTTTHDYTRRILVQNTKMTSVPRLRILDQVPVSEQPDVITVKLVNPPLTLPSTETSFTSGSGNLRSVRSKRVSSNVVAQFSGLGDEGNDDDAVGRDGKLEWIVKIPAQEKVHLVLNWKVTHPDKINPYGLDV